MDEAPAHPAPGTPDQPTERQAGGMKTVHPDLGRGLSLWGLIRSDYQAILALERVRPRSLRRRLDALTIPGFWAVVIFRLSAALHRAGLFPLARLLWFLNVVLFGIEASPRARVGPGFVVPHPVSVGFGAGAVIGRNVIMLNGVHVGVAGYDDSSKDGFPVIGNNCRIMDGAKLLGPIEIGDGAVIGANALVMRSIPAGAVVATTPARVIRIESPENSGADPSNGA